MPSLAAAPCAPETFPLLCASAASICSCSVDILLAPPTRRLDWNSCESQFLSTENSFVSTMISERSITFCSSRTFPGQEYYCKASIDFFRIVSIFLSGSLRVTIDEVVDENRNVLFAFAQRRQFNWKNVEPVKKIAAKRTGRDRGVKIAIGRGNHAHVAAQHLGSANPFKLAFLQNTEQRDLRFQGEIAHFIEEKCPAFCQFKPAKPPLNCSRECSFLVAKQLRHDQRRGDRRAIH